MALRSGMHHAGAVALTQLLQFAQPSADQRSLACDCGHQARYVELRSKPVLSAVGEVRVSRPYYLCAHCHTGQFPADVELDIENTGLSPTVRRMQALVGQEAAFNHGREQFKMLAALEVTTKAVERTAEAIGGDIAKREQQEIQRAVQLDLPIVVGEPIPILYVQMDGTGVPVVKKENLSALALSRPAVRPSSVLVLNSPGCSGPCAAPTQYWPYDAATSMAGLKTTGRFAGPPDLHFCVAHPSVTVSGHRGTGGGFLDMASRENPPVENRNATAHFPRSCN